ncbi:MAG TPA: efflux RND transporter permease subunit [Saprospiraceae bacterium]|nr:efflux RND transporter permease subunit [Saprospiraceae bacterium]HMQ82370.1 efflux RND transporter permease subunit [Saprospiraceae bacterium]
MRAVINYFIKNPVAANLIMFGILIMGYFGLNSMKSTFFPEVESRNILIQIVYPGASPSEIEEGIVNKIEENLKGVTGVERYTSVSSENAGTVIVEAFKGYKTDLVLQDVKNAVDQISSFPVGMEPPIIFKQENLGFAINFALSGPSDLAALKRYGRKVEDELLAMEGISKVELSGFPEEEIEIAFREKDLRAYQLTFQQAAQAVRATNLEITGGTIKGEKEELLLRARNKAYYAEGLRDIVVKTNQDGSVVLLHQVADIIDKWADNPNRSYLNGQQSVVVTVQNTLEEDMLTITEMVNDYIEQFNQENQEVKATLIRDGSVLLRQRIDLLTENGILGFCIVVLLLAMFLHWRLAFWVAIAIPVSFAGMFLLADAVGVTINVISLFGMIIVVGILVDDGIVIGENIYQKYEQGVPRLKAALDGTIEVLPAVFAAILTTVIAFASFLFIEGQLGDFFSQMAIVVMLSLIFSLIEGAIILPTHVAHSKALSPDRKPNWVQEGLDRMMYWMSKRFYLPVLKAATYNKFLTVAVFIGLLLLTFGAMGGGIIQSTFFPIIERDDIEISLQMPAGTSENITTNRLSHIEAAAWRANEKLSKRFFNDEKQAILRVEKNIGPSTYQGSLSIALLDGESRDSLSLREVTNTIREEAGLMPDVEVITYGQRSAFGKPISISLVGDNIEELRAATVHVKKEMQQLEELADVVDNNQEGLREVNIELKEKALFLGLNIQEVLTQVRNGFFGNEVQRLQRGRDEVRVWARYAEEDRTDITQLENMRIRFQDGREFPLSEIAELSIKRGIININHIDGKREIKIESDVSRDDVSVSDITNNLRDEMLPAILKNYPSVTALFEGQNREQEKSVKSMQTVGSIMLALMFFIIALTFRSIGQAIVVFLLIPFGMIGVGWGHWVMGAPISLFSALGIIALIGILVNDSLVFVSTYNKLIEDGMPQMEAIYEAGGSRFRPILLTSLTTFAGLMPLLFEKSLQAQFLIPMAISVSFGLLAVTVVNLVLLPVLLIVLNRAKVYATYAWNGVKPNYEDVEVGVKRESGYEFLWYVILTVVGLVAALSFIL